MGGKKGEVGEGGGREGEGTEGGVPTRSCRQWAGLCSSW